MKIKRLGLSVIEVAVGICILFLIVIIFCGIFSKMRDSVDAEGNPASTIQQPRFEVVEEGRLLGTFGPHVRIVKDNVAGKEYILFSQSNAMGVVSRDIKVEAEISQNPSQEL